VLYKRQAPSFVSPAPDRIGLTSSLPRASRLPATGSGRGNQDKKSRRRASNWAPPASAYPAFLSASCPLPAGEDSRNRGRIRKGLELRLKARLERQFPFPGSYPRASHWPLTRLQQLHAAASAASSQETSQPRIHGRPVPAHPQAFPSVVSSSSGTKWCCAPQHGSRGGYCPSHGHSHQGPLLSQPSHVPSAASFPCPALPPFLLSPPSSQPHRRAT